MRSASSAQVRQTHMSIIHLDEARYHSSQLVLIQPSKDAVEHELRGEQLVGGVNLAGSPSLQRVANQQRA